MSQTLPLFATARPRLPQSLSPWLEPLLVASLVALALLVRWPELFMSPPFPAVGNTVIEAMAVANGETVRFADQAPYLGAPFLYILAAAYKLFGTSVEVTLIVTWIIGGLTIVPTYLLGRELGGRLTGAIAAGLMVTSPAHTVISSHVPWVHSMTPLFATTTLWLLARAVTRGHRRTLVLAGLAAGLTLQTHPTVLPLLGAAALVAVLISVRRLGVRPAVLFAICVVVGYSPLLLHHVQTRFAVVADVQSKQSRYLDADQDAGESADRGVYLNNLEQLGASLARLTSGDLEERASVGAFLRDPRTIVYPAIGLLGLMAGRRRIGWFLLAGVMAGILLPPIFNGKYKPVLDGRYIMPLVPVLFVGAGMMTSRIARRLSESPLRFGGASLAAVGIAGLTLAPLVSLGNFYEQTREDGASNARYMRTLERVSSLTHIGETVWLDQRLREVKTPGGGNAGSSLRWLLAVSDRQVREWEPGAGALPPEGSVVIVHRSNGERLEKELPLMHVDDPGAGRTGASYRVAKVRTVVAAGETSGS